MYVSRFGLISCLSCPDVMFSERAEESYPCYNRMLSTCLRGTCNPSSIRLDLPWPIQVSSGNSNQMTLLLSPPLQAWRGVCSFMRLATVTSHRSSSEVVVGQRCSTYLHHIRHKLTSQCSFAAGRYSQFPKSIQVLVWKSLWAMSHWCLLTGHINCGPSFRCCYWFSNCTFFGLFPQSWPIRNLEVRISFMLSVGCKHRLPSGRTRLSISSFSGPLTLESWRGK